MPASIRSPFRPGIVAILMLLGSSPVAATDELPEGFIRIFNGRDLTNWEGNLDVFRVEDEAVVAGSLENDLDHNEFLCTTREYEDFELRLEARLTPPTANAGIQFRSQRIPDHHEVRGYQADMGIETDRNIWGALYDESRRNKMLAVANPKQIDTACKRNDWNAYTIRCKGNRIQLFVNGVKTVDYTERDDSIERSGIIGLQIHSGPASEARYRNIMIKHLKE